jgi:hypothetical protein
MGLDVATEASRGQVGGSPRTKASREEVGGSPRTESLRGYGLIAADDRRAGEVIGEGEAAADRRG